MGRKADVPRVDVHLVTEFSSTQRGMVAQIHGLASPFSIVEMLQVVELLFDEFDDSVLVNCALRHIFLREE
jgi:hypothetical protein